MNLQLFTQQNAPAASQSLLDKSAKSFGMVPNLYAVMAGSAPVLEAYQQLAALFQKTSFTTEEQTVVWQTINVEHGCSYCVPAHTAVAHSAGVPPELTKALRSGGALQSEKLQVLRATTLELVRERGHLREETLEAFAAAGYKNYQLLELCLGLAQKVMSNYINHLADTPLDAVFEKFRWKNPSAAQAAK